MLYLNIYIKIILLKFLFIQKLDNSEFIMINNRISGNIFKASNNITAIQRMIQNNSINNPKINEQQ